MAERCRKSQTSFLHKIALSCHCVFEKPIIYSVQSVLRHPQGRGKINTNFVNAVVTLFEGVRRYIVCIFPLYEPVAFLFSLNPVKGYFKNSYHVPTPTSSTLLVVVIFLKRMFMGYFL